jgi:alkaline ceramidase
MTSIWEPMSSEVDWCESNYEVSPYFAEFYNTFSNILFIIIPPFMMYLFRSYSLHVTSDVDILWLLLILVGIGSGYFHATLSLSGQLVDELAILWVLMAALSAAIPDRTLSQSSLFKGNRSLLKWILLGVAALGTVLAFINPVMNAFLLMLFGIPFIHLLSSEVRNCRNWTVIRLCFTSMAWWVLAITCWINDRMFCDIWKSFSFKYPQLHSWWHVLITIASYTGIVLMAYFRAKEIAPDMNPRIVFWPKQLRRLGIPYIVIEHKKTVLAPEKIE